MDIQSALYRWNSPSTATALVVLARSLAFFAPLPILKAFYLDSILVFWLLAVSIQSFANALCGALPTLSMQMLAYAFAGSRRVTGTAAEHHADQMGQPNWLLISYLNQFLRKVFFQLSALFLVIAVSAGTALLWRQLNDLPSFHEGLWVWGLLIAGIVMRLLSQPFQAFLFACGETTLARQCEALSWMAAAILASVALLLSRSPVWGMLGLQLPSFFLFVVFYRQSVRRGWRLARSDEGTGSDQDILREVWPRTWRGIVGTLTAILTIYGSGYIFSRYGVPSEVAGYMLSLNLLGQIGQLSAAPVLGFMPIIATHYAQNTPVVDFADRVCRRVLWAFVAMCLIAPMAVATLNMLIPKPIPFVSTGLWIALCVAHFIMRYGATHLQLFTVTNDIRWHIINSVYLVATLGPILAWNNPPVWAFPAVQIVSGTVFYASYTRHLTATVLNYPIHRDIRTLMLPALALLAGFVVISWVERATIGWFP